MWPRMPWRYPAVVVSEYWAFRNMTGLHGPRHGHRVSLPPGWYAGGSHRLPGTCRRGAWHLPHLLIVDDYAPGLDVRLDLQHGNLDWGLRGGMRLCWHG